MTEFFEFLNGVNFKPNFEAFSYNIKKIIAQVFIENSM